MRFERNVFINCPFDDDYMPLLRPLLFSVYALGFVPRIALERLDSGRPRIDKIVALISPSQIWADFIEFISDKDADLARRGYTRQDIEGLPIRELMRYMRDGLATRQRT